MTEPGQDIRVMQQVLSQAMDTTATEVPAPTTLPVLAGAVPPDLRGVLLRNGPGRSERGGVRYGHPFDGDGFIQRLALADGVARYTARYVQTREFGEEEAAGRVLYRGFGTNRPGGWWRNALRMRFKNAANTSVVQHAGHTLALWEGGLPHAIDPDTLETRGRFDYDGALLNRFSSLEQLIAPELPFAAHPSIDPETGELFSFGTSYGVRNRLLIHRVSPAGKLTTRALVLSKLPFVHDMALTRRFVVFMLPSVTFNVPAALLGLRTPVDSLRMAEGPGMALLVPRDGGEPIRIPTAPGFVFHWAAAWEDGDLLTLEGVKYPGFPALDALDQMFGEDGAPAILAKPTRITLDLQARTATEQQLADCTMELPTAIGAGPSRVLVGVGAPAGRKQPFFSALVRLDADNRLTLRDLYPDLPGEPVFADGHLLVPMYRRGGQGELWIVDPDTLQETCRLGLPHPVPPPLHGTWLAG